MTLTIATAAIAVALITIALVHVTSLSWARASQAAEDRVAVRRMLEETQRLADCVHAQVERIAGIDDRVTVQEETVSNARADIQQLFDRAGIPRNRNKL